MKRYLRLGLLLLPLLPMAATGAPEQAAKKPAQHNHRGAKQLMLENADGATITLWKPDLTTLPLQLSHGGLTLPSTGMDNYHAVIAEKEWGDSKETVIRYEYLFGRPSKHSPSELAGAIKTDLEIVPAPIPREHFRYLSDQRWGFLVRLHGLPVAGRTLALETEYGSRLQAVTDKQGYAEFRLPDDFPDVVAGERDRRKAEFTITVSAEDGGIDYQTMLSASYHPNPSHWQSAPMGWAVVGIGFIAGGMLGRQRRSRGKTA